MRVVLVVVVWNPVVYLCQIRFVLVVAQLAPEAADDDGDKRNDSREYQAQEPRSDRAQQHRLAHLPLSRVLRRRGGRL